jgi:L-threonylcarbamoyladenylate synthase
MTETIPMDDKGLARAARVLRRGGLVAFPTETVYGLGADATDDRAVARIFEAKGRPTFNPLIVHVPDIKSAMRHVDLGDAAHALADHFWPGPLTLVLPRRERCRLSPLVGAGLETVAIRLPAHGGARDLMRLVDRPLAAPSANASGMLSPTEAAHVASSLAGGIDLILDGGPCAVGLESTVVDLSGPAPVLLRHGGLAVEALEAVLGGSLARSTNDDSAPKSPGMLLKHYAPRLPLRLNATKARPGEALIGFGPGMAEPNLSPTGSLTEAAARLFRLLHAADDASKHRGIAVAPVPETGLGVAINDRLRRASER